MNDNKNNMQYNAGEIDIRDLFMALWNRKIMIICFTIIAAIIAGLISTFFISPVYETELNIIISMPETYKTRFGEYTLPITSNEQYINLIKSNDVIINTIKDMGYDSNEISVEDLKERISLVSTKATDSIQNIFSVIVTADNPDETLKLAETLFNNYSNFLDIMTKESAANFYINDFGVQIKTLNSNLQNTKEILQKNEDLLANTPQTIIQGDANIEIQSELTNNSDYIIPVNSINPNYIKIENDIISNKQSINYIESNIKMNNQFLEELEKEKIEYNKTGQEDKLESSVTSVVKNSVYLPSQPVEPTQKSSPNTAINTLIGIAIGGVIGVVFALIKEYCFIKE